MDYSRGIVPFRDRARLGSDGERDIHCMRERAWGRENEIERERA